MNQWKRCLYCGADNHNANYSCDCILDVPAHNYRNLGLGFRLDAREINEVRAAYKNYRFDNQRGMLQYPLLPNREYARETDLTVGLTPLHFLKSFSKRSGIEVYLKDEGQNPSGCFKDRETMSCLLNTRKHNRKRAVIYSSGNAAASAALIAKQQNIHLVTFVPGDTYSEKIAYIQKCGSDVIVVGKGNTSFEEGFRLFVQLNEANVFEDAGFDDWAVRNPYRVQGDKTTAVEIAKQLESMVQDPIPDAVIVPSANGSNLAGIWEGFKELKSLGITDRLPRMVVVGITKANPICKAVQLQEKRKPVTCDLSELQERDEKIGSIIVAEEGYDSVEAAKAVLESGGTAVELGAHHIRKVMVRFLQKERRLALKHNVLPEPASYLALAAVEQLRARRALRFGERAVAVITGHGVKAQRTTQSLLMGYPKLFGTARQIMGRKKQESPVLGGSSRMGHRKFVQADVERLRSEFYSLAETKDVCLI